MRAPLVPMGSLATWTMTSWPTLRRSWMFFISLRLAPLAVFVAAPVAAASRSRPRSPRAVRAPRSRSAAPDRVPALRAPPGPTRPARAADLGPRRGPRPAPRQSSARPAGRRAGLGDRRFGDRLREAGLRSRSPAGRSGRRASLGGGRAGPRLRRRAGAGLQRGGRGSVARAGSPASRVGGLGRRRAGRRLDGLRPRRPRGSRRRAPRPGPALGVSAGGLDRLRLGGRPSPRLLLLGLLLGGTSGTSGGVLALGQLELRSEKSGSQTTSPT